jgi:hypothetical protein
MFKNLFFVLLFVLFLCGIATAQFQVEFRVEFDSRFSDPGTVVCDRYFTIDIYMHNLGGQINGFGFPFAITGPQIYWVDAGGRLETGGSLDIFNGFAPGDYRFTALNLVDIPDAGSWDGILPDSILHVTATTVNGWHINEGELLVYRFHASAGSEAGEICIDSTGWYNGMEWLWFPWVDFGGPYCAQIENWEMPQAPWFVSGCPPETIDINWGIAKKDTLTMEVGLDADLIPGDALSGVMANLGVAVITDSISNNDGGAFINWSLDADFDMLGSHDVQISVYDHYSIPYDHAVVRNACNFTLNIINTPPIVTAYNCGDTLDCCIGTSIQFPFQVTDVNVGDVLSFGLTEDAGGRALISSQHNLITFTDTGNDSEALYEVIAAFSDRAEDSTFCTIYFNVRACCGDVNADGSLNLMDILYLIEHIYGIPPGPPPGEFAQGDVHTDGYLNLLDIIYLIRYLYGVSTGSAPPRCL